MEPVYRSVIGIARTIFAFEGLKFEVEGEENIPASGGAVIAVNHTGYMDFTYAGLPPRRVKRYIRFMAKKEVFDNKISGPIMRALRHIPVDRGAGAESYKAAVQSLRNGELVGVYPEATISRSFEIKEFKSGAARMAIAADVPIVVAVNKCDLPGADHSDGDLGRAAALDQGPPETLGPHQHSHLDRSGPADPSGGPAEGAHREAPLGDAEDAAGTAGELPPRAGGLLGSGASGWQCPHPGGSRQARRPRRCGTRSQASGVERPDESPR